MKFNASINDTASEDCDDDDDMTKISFDYFIWKLT